MPVSSPLQSNPVLRLAHPGSDQADSHPNASNVDRVSVPGVSAESFLPSGRTSWTASPGRFALALAGTVMPSSGVFSQGSSVRPCKDGVPGSTSLHRRWASHRDLVKPCAPRGSSTRPSIGRGCRASFATEHARPARGRARANFLRMGRNRIAKWAAAVSNPGWTDGTALRWSYTHDGIRTA
jgi:hypothetical protein